MFEVAGTSPAAVPVCDSNRSKSALATPYLNIFFAVSVIGGNIRSTKHGNSATLAGAVVFTGQS
jgi:hypothetical protein